MHRGRKLSSIILDMERESAAFVFDIFTCSPDLSLPRRPLDLSRFACCRMRLWLVEPAVVAQSDRLIDVGPGAGDEGGRIVAGGVPETVARCQQSRTARYLRAALSLANWLCGV